MKKERAAHHQFSSIQDAHRQLGLPAPRHPLISMINNHDTPLHPEVLQRAHILNFYKISYKPVLSGKLRYGQHHYDFDGGGLLFAAPRQLIGSPEDSGAAACSLYTLLIHPDFFLGYPIAKKIRQYGFFSYSAHEALHLSEEERQTVLTLLDMIGGELNSRIDELSQDVVIAQIELLLTLANRFYKRQFITRKTVSHELLQQLETLLDAYLNDEQLLRQGVPTVAYLAGQLHLSPSYLSDMLRSLTGQNAQQHIHEKLIEKAKELLSATSLSVSEVAYALGFEYAQSFSKLFKSKTQSSPLAFRQQFN